MKSPGNSNIACLCEKKKVCKYLYWRQVLDSSEFNKSVRRRKKNLVEEFFKYKRTCFARLSEFHFYEIFWCPEVVWAENNQRLNLIYASYFYLYDLRTILDFKMWTINGIFYKWLPHSSVIKWLQRHLPIKAVIIFENHCTNGQNGIMVTFLVIWKSPGQNGDSSRAWWCCITKNTQLKVLSVCPPGLKGGHFRFRMSVGTILFRFYIIHLYIAGVSWLHTDSSTDLR